MTGTPTGKMKHPAYYVWRSMIDRTRNPNSRAWKDYGGRGISMCERWQDFWLFVQDMGPKPTRNHSIERIRNDGNYEPGNCRWATKKEQQRNRRNTVKVVIEGAEYLLAELAEKSGRKPDTIKVRAEKGMTYEEVMSAENYPFKDGWRKAVAVRVANQKAKTHCKHGHEFTPKNTYVFRGSRACRACARLTEERRRMRLRSRPT